MSAFNTTDSSNAESTTWLTPLWFVRELGEFDLDPCAYPGHQTAKRLICLPTAGLMETCQGRVWLYPTFGIEAPVWLVRLQRHGDGIALVFARLDTKWIQPFLDGGFFQCEGRLSFISDREGFKGRSGAGNILIPFGRKNAGRIVLSDLKGRWFQ